MMLPPNDGSRTEASRSDSRLRLPFSVPSRPDLDEELQRALDLAVHQEPVVTDIPREVSGRRSNR